MTQAVAHLLNEIERLSAPERADLADRLVETLTREIPSDVERAQLDEVRRRIGQVESGKVALIPGDQALASVRQMVDAARLAK
jgi:putative addiction module component (TIGR02574 family)